MPLHVTLLPALADNYIFVLADAADPAQVAVVDPGDAAPVHAHLHRTGTRLRQILLTHHHHDHIGGVAALVGEGVEVIGAAADRHRLPPLTRAVSAGDRVAILGRRQAQVLDVPGHTHGHVAYALTDDPADPLLFCGDALFVLGCGRLSEGTAAEAWPALAALRTLPPATRIFSAHEYGATNAAFARQMLPGDAAIQARAAAIAAARAAGTPTVPALLAEERASNPFLRADDPDVADALGLAGAPPVQVYAALRTARNSFKLS